MKKYIIISSLYRFLCGMILLAINWSFATNNNDQYLTLAIATCISFIPALFVPFLLKPFIKKYSGKKITSISLGIMSIIIFPLVVFPNVNYIKLAIYFLIWCTLFVMESSWEMWFVDLSKNKDKDAVNKYSSISITSNQCALMLGPLAVPFLLNVIDYKLFYLVVVIGGLILGFACYKQNDPYVKSENQESPSKIKVKFDRILLAALVLVWPILGSFNFMLPVHVAQQSTGKMLDVGVLDMAMSAGMALIGFITLWHIISKLGLLKIVSLGMFIIIGMVSWWLFSLSAIGDIAGILFLGLGFGGLRIELRSQLAQRLPSSEVGSLVSSANAFALPILATTIFISRMYLKFVWVPPFVLSLVFFILIIVLNRNTVTICDKNLSVS